jgi:hypothetical protein
MHNLAGKARENSIEWSGILAAQGALELIQGTGATRSESVKPIQDLPWGFRKLTSSLRKLHLHGTGLMT